MKMHSLHVYISKLLDKRYSIDIDIITVRLIKVSLTIQIINFFTISRFSEFITRWRKMFSERILRLNSGKTCSF